MSIPLYNYSLHQANIHSIGKISIPSDIPSGKCSFHQSNINSIRQISIPSDNYTFHQAIINSIGKISIPSYNYSFHQAKIFHGINIHSFIRQYPLFHQTMWLFPSDNGTSFTDKYSLFHQNNRHIHIRKVSTHPGRSIYTYIMKSLSPHCASESNVGMNKKSCIGAILVVVRFFVSETKMSAPVVQWVVERGTTMWMDAGSNSAQTEVASAVVRS